MTVASIEYKVDEATLSSGVGHSTSPNLEYYNYCSSTLNARICTKNPSSQFNLNGKNNLIPFSTRRFFQLLFADGLWLNFSANVIKQITSNPESVDVYR